MCAQHAPQAKPGIIRGSGGIPPCKVFEIQEITSGAFWGCSGSYPLVMGGGGGAICIIHKCCRKIPRCGGVLVPRDSCVSRITVISSSSTAVRWRSSSYRHFCHSAIPHFQCALVMVGNNNEQTGFDQVPTGGGKDMQLQDRKETVGNRPQLVPTQSAESKMRPSLCIHNGMYFQAQSPSLLPALEDQRDDDQKSMLLYRVQCTDLYWWPIPS